MANNPEPISPCGSNHAQAMVLTGCASGIGRHLAGRLAEAGHLLTATDINLEALEAAAETDGWPRDRVARKRLDVRCPDQWRGLIDEVVGRYGRIDVLWNIAGYVRPGYVHETSPEQIALHLDTNAKGTMLGSQLAAAQMARQGYGHIVNIASMAALAPVPGIALYTASKFAVRGFSLALAQELKPHGVSVTVVCPDAVQTPMLDLQIDYPEAALTFSGSRQLTVEEVGDLLVGRVLRSRPLEATLPRHRGFIARLTSFWPALAGMVGPVLAKQGLARQARFKRRRERAAGSLSTS